MRPGIKPDPALAAAVQRLRRGRGITQEAFAFKAGVTIATLSRIERGVTTPAWTTLQDISGALGITLQDLAGAAEREQTHPSPAHGGGE
jgi:transcriptional regulator with XRE-family HTH domain